MEQFDLNALIEIAPEIATLMDGALTEGSNVTWMDSKTETALLLPLETTRDGNLRRIHLFGDKGEYLGEVGVVRGFLLNRHLPRETLQQALRRLSGTHRDVHVVDVQSYYNPPALNIASAHLYLS